MCEDPVLVKTMCFALDGQRLGVRVQRQDKKHEQSERGSGFTLQTLLLMKCPRAKIMKINPQNFVRNSEGISWPQTPLERRTFPGIARKHVTFAKILI